MAAPEFTAAEEMTGVELPGLAAVAPEPGSTEGIDMRFVKVCALPIAVPGFGLLNCPSRVQLIFSCHIPSCVLGAAALAVFLDRSPMPPFCRRDQSLTPAAVNRRTM